MSVCIQHNNFKTIS